MERPAIKPVKRMFDIWKRVERKHSKSWIVKVEFNCEETEESHADANEYNAWHYNVYVNVTFLTDNTELITQIITVEDFKAWFTFDPGMDGVWTWNRDVDKTCSEWAKFLRCEERDLETYKKLKAKFE